MSWPQIVLGFIIGVCIGALIVLGAWGYYLEKGILIMKTTVHKGVKEIAKTGIPDDELEKEK